MPTRSHRLSHRASLIAIASFALVSACSPMLTTPTAPSVSWSPAAAAAATRLELVAAAPDRASGVAHLAIRAIAADGNTATADVSCRASSGHVTPARFDPLTHGVLELAATTTLTTVTCETGALRADVDVDMSAWWIVLDGNQYVPLGDGAGESRVVVAPQRRIDRIEATRVQLNWGDGAIETLPYVPASTPSTRFHRYQSPGHYVVTGRIEWLGGAHESRLSVSGGPPGSQP